MSFVVNDPADFADEAAAGFVAAHRTEVRQVPGGVARAVATPEGEVAVVIGGGSGHYPAFAGLVGPGLAHGAAMGNVFASPSAQHVYGVASAVEAGAGVLLSYGNYAGDVLNFDEAERRLRAAGIPCRTVRVTDDISSASVEERDKRRGIAGDLVVFRVAAWAAEQGRDLDAVHALASHANERTRSIGVAFGGCTLPGADAALFTVADGQMAIGMGIHGEPGIETVELESADAISGRLVDALLAERPDDIETEVGARVGVIVNGLGSVKGEELFVVFGAAARALEAAGLVIVDPEVGEFATSFEMAGLSLTLVWLDDELEQAWGSPAATPAYRKGALAARAGAIPATVSSPDDDAAVERIPTAGEGSRAAAVVALAGVDAIRDLIEREADELGRLDAIAGDGDHGIGMRRGTRAAAEAATRALAGGAGVGTLLALAGDAWALKAGGTSGALWGAALRTLGERLGDEVGPDAAAVANAVDAARTTVQTLGKAELGDKTMVDAIIPFADALVRHVGAGVALADAWAAAAVDATRAAEATARLRPNLGRARPHVEKSLGTPDPGAISFAQSMTAVGAMLRGENKE